MLKKLNAKGKSVTFETLEVEVDVPEYKNSYPKYEYNQDNLIKNTNIRKKYIYTTIHLLRFATRCTELAFYLYGDDRLPGWLGGNTKWESDFKLPKKRIKWDRLKLCQPKVGDFSIAIRKRIKYKKEIMNEKYEL